MLYFISPKTMYKTNMMGVFKVEEKEWIMLCNRCYLSNDCIGGKDRLYDRTNLSNSNKDCVSISEDIYNKISEHLFNDKYLKKIRNAVSNVKDFVPAEYDLYHKDKEFISKHLKKVMEILEDDPELLDYHGDYFMEEIEGYVEYCDHHQLTKFIDGKKLDLDYRIINYCINYIDYSKHKFTEEQLEKLFDCINESSVTQYDKVKIREILTVHHRYFTMELLSIMLEDGHEKDIIDIYLKHNDINLVKDGKTLLSLIIFFDLDLVKYLVKEKGADLHLGDLWKEVDLDNRDIVDFLIENKVKTLKGVLYESYDHYLKLNSKRIKLKVKGVVVLKNESDGESSEESSVDLDDIKF